MHGKGADWSVVVKKYAKVYGAKGPSYLSNLLVNRSREELIESDKVV